MPVAVETHRDLFESPSRGRKLAKALPRAEGSRGRCLIGFGRPNDAQLAPLAPVDRLRRDRERLQQPLQLSWPLRCSSAVPRYYFHLLNDERTATDEEGVELPDVAVAMKRAANMARQKAAESMHERRVIFDCQAEVTDESGESIGTVLSSSTW